MSNSFNISDKPEIAANLVQILSNASALATIQITDLPAIDALIDILDTNIDAIIDTHLPGIITEIDANETKIDAIINNHIPGTNAKVDVNLAAIDIIDGIVDAIKLKTDLIPQSFRGTFTHVGAYYELGTYVNLINLTSSSGKLLYIALHNLGDTNITIKVTIDGLPSNEILHDTVDTTRFVIPNYSLDNDLELTISETFFNIPFEFKDSLKIECKRTAGALTPTCNAGYNLD